MFRFLKSIKANGKIIWASVPFRQANRVPSLLSTNFYWFKWFIEPNWSPFIQKNGFGIFNSATDIITNFFFFEFIYRKRAHATILKGKHDFWDLVVQYRPFSIHLKTLLHLLLNIKRLTYKQDLYSCLVCTYLGKHIYIYTVHTVAICHSFM